MFLSSSLIAIEMNKIDTLVIRRPDDWHLHLRDGQMLSAVAIHSARCFGRAIVMPNLSPPVTTCVAAQRYRDEIKSVLPASSNFRPLMTCFLTDLTDPREVQEGFNLGIFSAVKLYPSGVTTNSESGVTDINKITGVLEAMQNMGMPLLVHGEVTDPEIDIFDREAVFIDRVLRPMMARFPALKIVFEHITTSEAVEFVRSESSRLAATITVHHLLIDRNDMFKGGIRPHYYCLPVAKRQVHRMALVDAATSGEAKFFLGTDSAPHEINAKESACGCAGIFSSPLAIELYTQVFDRENALDKLEAFASLNGPNFYGLPKNEEKITLVREPWKVPESIKVKKQIEIIPFMAGEIITWRVLT